MDYSKWFGVNNWVRNMEKPMQSEGTGGFAKWRKPKSDGRAPRTDPGGNAYGDSDWALKTNERSLAKTRLY